MKNPLALYPKDEFRQIGQVFGAPLVVKGKTWLPLAEVIAWSIVSWVERRRHPDWRRGKWLAAGVIGTVAVLGSEWCHNLAHAAAAHWIGKPMDAMRIAWGMPLINYYDINDGSVTPRQHITRALGGPILNLLMLPLLGGLKRATRPGSLAGEFIVFALGANAFIGGVALLPIPGIDGGPVLKWSLVAGGRTPGEADEAVKKVNLALGAGLGVAAGAAIKKRSWLLGIIMTMFAASALGVGLGWIKER